MKDPVWVEIVLFATHNICPSSPQIEAFSMRFFGSSANPRNADARFSFNGADL